MNSSPRQTSPARVVWRLCTYFMLVVFFLSLASASVIANIAIEKSQYEVGETVLIAIDDSSMTYAEVRVVAGTKVFHYKGIHDDILEFTPKEPGNYSAVIQDIMRPNDEFAVDFTVYETGKTPGDEQVSLNATNTSITELDINNSLSANNTSEEPTQIVEEEFVEEIDSSEYQHELTISAHNITLGQSLDMHYGVNLTDSLLYIIAPSETLRYMGELTFPLTFSPTSTGEHIVQLETRTHVVIGSATFTVLPATQPVEKTLYLPAISANTSTLNYSALAQEIAKKQGPIVVLDAQGTVLNISAQKSKNQGIVATARRVIGLEENTTLNIGEIANTNITFASGPITNMQLNDLTVQNGTRIGVDVVPKSHVAVEKTVKKAYAIDLSDADFSEGTVTAIATGTELYKCADWNFTRQECFGTWVKVQDLVPGEEYSFAVYPGDPGYAETGLTSINTRRPIHEPDEIVTLLMVVLDSGGFLVQGAEMYANITSPDGALHTYSHAEGISESSKGVYAFDFSSTTLEGEYDVSVVANDTHQLVNMSSYFVIADTYAFDIYRGTPVVIDPFTEALSSWINITPNVASAYSVTERLPDTFSNIDAPGATITANGTSWLLTWNNLTGQQQLSYTADAPRISPSLQVLGPINISYNNDSENILFAEARPWYLALDPDASGTPKNTLSFFMTDYSGGDKKVDNSDFDERPIQMNDYGDVSLKCETWSCDTWAESGTNKQGAYCSGEWNCTSLNGTICQDWECTGRTNTNNNDVVYCSSGWDCTAFSGDECTTWDCPTWTAVSTADRDTYCSGSWTCDSFTGDNCDSWSCSSNAEGGTDDTELYCEGWTCNSYTNGYCDDWSCDTWTANTVKQDAYCSGGWDCTVWSSDDTCGQWACAGWSSGSNDADAYCQEWNCTDWNATTSACNAWDCTTWTIGATGQRDYYCASSWACTEFETFVFNQIPNVTALNNPVDNALVTTSTVDFNFTVTDDVNVTNCTLYADFGGVWSANKTVTTVINNTETNITVSAVDDVNIWNVLCYDDDGDSGWFTTNYTVNIDTTGPSMALLSPSDASVLTNDTVAVACRGTDSTDIVNVSLYTNHTGVLALNQTVNFTSPHNTTATANFNITGIADLTSMEWDCEVYDIAGSSSFAASSNSFYVNYSADAAPVATLNAPSNTTIVYADTYQLSCSATDDNDISSLNLYTNQSGTFQFAQTQNYPGSADTSVTKNFTVTGLTEGAHIAWNCRAIDSAAQQRFATDTWLFSVDLLEPNVTLVNPQNGNTVQASFDFNCSVTDNSDVASVSLYHSIDGSWMLNQTQTFPGSGETSVQANFSVVDTPAANFFSWNCLATDEDGLTSWAANNFTAVTEPEGTVHHALSYDAGSSWSDPENAYLAPDGVTSDEELSKQKNLIVYNFSNLPSGGTLLRTYLSLRWHVEDQPDTDDLLFSYSDDDGVTFYNLDGSAYSGASGALAYPSSPSNQSYEITAPLTVDDLPTLRHRIIGSKVSDDKLDAYIDSMWITTIHSPAPTYSNISKNQTAIYQNDNVIFYTTWTDDMYVDCAILSINQSGTFVNSSCLSIEQPSGLAAITYNITATAGTTVEWLYYANDSYNAFNQTPLQTFTVADPSDVVSPSVNSIFVTPTTAPSTTIFNISANVTDNIALTDVYAEISFPSGTITNYSMTQLGGGDIWQYLFTSIEGGNHSYRVFGLDGASNTDVSSRDYFNVTPRLWFVKQYYGRGETAPLRGLGYSVNGTVQIDIRDPSGTSATGYPVNISANSTGGFLRNWAIPATLTTPLGNYTAIGTDQNITFLNVSNGTAVVVRPYYALKLDENFPDGTVVTTTVNDSDDDVTLIFARNDEDFITFNFTNTLPVGYTPLTNTYFWLEHEDLGDEAVAVDVWDGSVFQNVCVFTLSATETINGCNISAYATTYATANNIQVMIHTENDMNKENFANIDFGFITMDFTIGNTLSVDITEPDLVTNTKEYSDTSNNKAYGGGDPDQPPGAQVTGTEATSGEYDQIELSDNDRWQYTHTTDGDRIYTSYYFTVSESVTDIDSLTFTWEGHVTKDTGFTAESYRVYAWNYNTNIYDEISAGEIDSPSESTQVITFPSVSAYINGSGQVNTLVQSKDKVDANPPKNRGDITTDFVKMDVLTIPTISGTQEVNITAVDGDGIRNCTYFFTNSSGFSFASQNTTEVTTFFYRNTTDTTQFDDGIYNITANCSDQTTETAIDIVRVRVSNSAPQVYLQSPINNSNLTANLVSFVWNASQSSGLPLCDLYIDGVENLSNIISNNGANTTRNVSGLIDGQHNWSVTCENTAEVTNSSQTWYFTVDVGGPIITLNDPADDASVNQTEVLFNYTPIDVSGVDNCSLILDDVVNQTNTSISEGSENSFTVTGITSGNHTWSVNCTDSFGYETSSSQYTFTADFVPPLVVLNTPTPGETIIGNFIQFNYTPTDNFDLNLVCNLTVNGIVEDANIASPNATQISRSVILGDGLKYWNVTCVDSAGNFNTSLTRTFTIEGDPTVNLISPTNNSGTNDGNVTFVYYVNDDNGIASCDLYINDIFNQTNATIVSNGANNNFSTVITQEQRLNWTVNCTDGTGRTGQANPYFLDVDFTVPFITLLKPDDSATFVASYVDFNFTVTDNLDTSLVCNITVQGAVNTSNTNFAALNGSITERNQSGMDSGINYWNVTCVDTAGNTNTSLTRNFFIGGTPGITLVTPTNNSFENENVTFVYNPNDGLGITSCDLYINDVFNQTNSTPITLASNNNFSLSGLAEQTLNWSVMCTNIANNTGSSQTYLLNIDTTNPSIVLNAPDEAQTLASTTVTFNWTTTDNNDTSLSCDLYVDGALNVSSIASTSGSPTTQLVSGFETGSHNWSLTCYDDALNSISSETRNFTVSFGPAVSLDTPEDGYVNTTGSVVLEYIVATTNPLVNCSLFIDDVYNQSNSTTLLNVGNGQPNNFTLSGLSEQIFNWTVACYDNASLSGTDTARTLHIDFFPPNVSLNAPADGANISLATVDFNFTAYDSLDDVLICNITVYNETGLFNSSLGVSATQGVPTVTSLSAFTAGNYSWNATCTDGAFTNYSETRNFSISPIPSIILDEPVADATLSSGNINFTYTPSTIAQGPPPGFQFCQLYLDGQANVNDVTITNGVLNGLVNSSVPEGLHTWFVYCLDQDDFSENSSTRNVTVDLTNPTVTAHDPDSTTLNSTVNFNWTATDNLDTSLSCNIYVNGTLNFTASSSNATATNNSVTGFDDGYYVWNATCYDNANRSASSSTLNFTVAEVPEIILGEPVNGTRNSTVNWTFYYTPTDNSGSIAACSLLINGAFNQTNTTIIQYGIENNFTVTNLPDGTYNWSINCTDPSGYEGINASEHIFSVDLTAPIITLDLPAEGQTFSDDDVFFNWTATDFSGTNITCDIYTDGTLNQTFIQTSPATFNVTIQNFTVGNHNWSVVCQDDLNNSDSSEVRNFTISEPDLLLNNSLVAINNTNPDLGENVTLTANVSNIGGSIASNILVEFWDGPVDTGTFIGNETLTSLAVNASYQFSTTWLITSGFHEIHFIVDPDNAISEQNETNNNATLNISVLSANITSPLNGTTFNTQSIDINFTLSDYTNGSITYAFFIDDIQNGTGSATDGANTNISRVIPDGTHTLIVQATDALSRNKNSTPITIIIDSTAPVITFNTPNATFFNSTSVQINFTATDAISTNISYRFFVDGVLNITGNTTNGTPTLDTLANVPEGAHQIIIEATDELGNIGNSSTLTIFVDLTPPVPLIETQNLTWFSLATPGIDFNITDNLDSTIDYILYVDGVADTAGTVPNATSSSANISAVADGNHTIILQGTDEAGNADNSTSIVIQVDTTAPIITLHNPLPAELLTSQNVTFNFTATDILDPLLVCTLTVSAEGQFAINAINATPTTYTLNNTAPGIHTWNVTCIDNAGNTNTSETRNFTIPAPDFVITAGNITLSNSTPIEDQVIEVNATVFNLGNSTGTNLNLSFYLGDPLTGGTLLQSYAIATLSVGANATRSINYTATIGQNDIYVVADPPTDTNGSIDEENESNNVAFQGFAVGLYNVFSGLTNNQWHIDDSTLTSLFTWDQENGTGAHILVADIDSSLDFTALQSLGRTTANVSQNDDFSDLDAALGSQNFTDNINITWTSGGPPIRTESYDVFGVDLINIPTVNSTNSTNFRTGILWDTSDGGTAYNGSQDVTFISQINESMIGYRGTYDYEVKVPALLDQLFSGTDAVSFYTEIR